MKIIFRLSFILCFLCITILLLIIFMKPVFISNNLMFPYSFEEFNIVEKYPDLWFNIKILYIFFYIISNIIISNSIFNLIFKNYKNPQISTKKEDDKKFKLFIGKDSDDNKIFIE